jgi:hypothetical protein
LPFILWRYWISQFPEGIPSSSWLLNNSHSQTFPNWYKGYNLSFLNKIIAFRPHWWYWLFQDRIGNLILGVYGIIPLFLGVAYQRKHYQSLALSLLAGIFVYFVIIAQGNIQHDYYQVLIIPSLSILCGVGYFYIYDLIFKSKILKIICLIIIFGLSTFFSYERVKEFYKINNPSIVSAGQVTKNILPTNSLIIAPYNGDTTLLFYTGFSGWPTEIYDIDQKISQHPNQPIYLLSTNNDKYTSDLTSKYPVINRTNDFIILKLSQ